MTDRAGWKGKIGVAPTNASFQAFVTAIRVKDGDDKAREFLAGLKANEPAIRDGNAPILEEINDGKIAVGLINHYYVGELAKEKASARTHSTPSCTSSRTVTLVRWSTSPASECSRTPPTTRMLKPLSTTSSTRRPRATSQSRLTSTRLSTA